MIDLGIRLNVGIAREDEHANRPCSVCRQRRVRYRVAVTSLFDGQVTDARCLECWVTDRQPSAPGLEVALSALPQEDVADEQTA
jgi:hypothetical protein